MARNAPRYGAAGSASPAAPGSVPAALKIRRNRAPMAIPVPAASWTRVAEMALADGSWAGTTSAYCTEA